MKDGYRFVDCDMHIMEPPDLFDKYLDPEFKHRVTSSVRRVEWRSTGMRGRPLWYFDGTPTSNDGNISQYNRIRGPLVSERANTNVMFAVERGYDAESQVMGMAMEGIDIAVLFPTAGLSFLARDNMDPQFSAAICRAYNDWIHEFVQHSPDQLKMAAMLPIHDVNLACAELLRCVNEYGAVGAFVRPNYVNGRYWHSNYWDPLYSLLQELNVPMCFHEGTGSYYSTIEPRFGENRFMRHVASHSTEMQLALIALMLGGIFEFYPRLKVAFLEAQSWWVPGLLGRIEWDMRQHHDSDAPYLKLTPLEYWQRNCFSAIESGENEVGSVVELLGGADNICVSSDFPHFDSSFPDVSTRVHDQPEHHPGYRRQDPVRRRPPLRLRRGGFRQGRPRRQAPRQHRRRARIGASGTSGPAGGDDMARDGFLILDSDLHMMEPDDLWARYLDEPYRAEPAAVFRRAARAAQKGRGRQGQRRLDHGHGGAGAGRSRRTTCSRARRYRAANCAAAAGRGTRISRWRGRAATTRSRP